jgi:hypothetical protein
MDVGGQRHAPAALAPVMTRYPLYRKVGGSQGLSGQVRKISPHPGFDHRTVQPVASCSTNYAIPADTIYNVHVLYNSERACPQLPVAVLDVGSKCS